MDSQITNFADKFSIKEDVAKCQVSVDKARVAGMQKDKSRAYLNSNSYPMLPTKRAGFCSASQVIFKVSLFKEFIGKGPRF